MYFQRYLRNFTRIPAIPHDLTGRHKIVVRTHDNMIAGPDLVLLLDYIWSHALVDLELLAADEID